MKQVIIRAIKNTFFDAITEVAKAIRLKVATNISYIFPKPIQ